MPPLPVDPRYDELVGLIYQGALEPRPWQSALPRLRGVLDAQVASLVLRPPSEQDRGAILNCVRPEPGDVEDTLADPDAWQSAAYQEEFFTLDPFINLPQDQVVALSDMLTEQELLASEYYRQYLEPVGLFHILGVDTGEPGGMLARLRFSRRREEGDFNDDERNLLSLVAPHLRRAIQIYATLNRTTSERDIYAGAVSQLAVASIILDEQARVISANPVAQALLEQQDGLWLKDQHLQVAGRNTNRELQQAVQDIIRAQHRGEASVVRALRVPRAAGHSPLGLLVRPVPPSQGREGQSSPCAAIFISDPDLHESADRRALGELFELTPAECNLAILLARGLSLAEASAAQSISQHTARAQLKSIFAKTGVSRQAELVRLVIKSVASLG
ncbi:helix-turn-helix transcriptional regulator [Pseudohalioglobus sediminis]|uniref:helix-turn-helix transcriptional regulator n=1 Tax=Pseudohalioglobus sediminis TaxID=2606449 RepID=UPI00165F62BE|nr:helix-turn-helix transcriptional regulator [Pseudohalioglobus sediminis]